MHSSIVHLSSQAPVLLPCRNSLDVLRFMRHNIYYLDGGNE